MRDADLFDRPIRHFSTTTSNGALIRVLDVGCGAGELVGALNARGYSAMGCDVEAEFSLLNGTGLDVHAIETDPYRLPFRDVEFDVVISNQVLEHVKNRSETLSEIRRVLKPGGVTIHAFPSKWYLPVEPHLYVPFASWFSPPLSRALIKIWAKMGFRKSYQKGYSVERTIEMNIRYFDEALSYTNNAGWRALFSTEFERYSNEAEFYTNNFDDGVTRFARNLPFRAMIAEICSVFRQRFPVAYRAEAGNAAPGPGIGLEKREAK